jgi:FKBP-type peptidyl-prolyl cis-trans isomerase
MRSFRDGFCVGSVLLLTLTAHAGQGEIKTLATTSNVHSAGIVAPPDVFSPPAEAQKTPSGLATKILKSGAGNEHPQDNDCVKIVFQAWRRDGAVFSTSGSSHEPITQCLRAAMPGIAEALKLMAVEEKRRIWLPADLTLAPVHQHGIKHLIDAVLPKVDLTFDIQLVEILRAPPTPPDQQPAEGSLKMPSGVFMQILKPGSGSRHPSVTSWLTVDYTGWTSDGWLFESTVMVNQPRLLLFGMTLPAWQECLPDMVTGEKVRLWIPGAQASGENSRSKSPSDGDLIYDLELLEIK